LAGTNDARRQSTPSMSKPPLLLTPSCSATVAFTGRMLHLPWSPQPRPADWQLPQKPTHSPKKQSHGKPLDDRAPQLAGFFSAAGTFCRGRQILLSSLRAAVEATRSSSPAAARQRRMLAFASDV